MNLEYIYKVVQKNNWFNYYANQIKMGLIDGYEDEWMDRWIDGWMDR